MAVTQENTFYAVKIEYKPSFDTTGNLTLPAYSQTFSKINENATAEQIKTFADAAMALTVYHNAPYKVSLVNTGELVTA